MVTNSSSLRPALRGWKHRFVVLYRCNPNLSPTRLEGMETFAHKIAENRPNMSPTRLEGMETLLLVPTDAEIYKSPTRLEGMETINSCKRLISSHVSDPP